MADETKNRNDELRERVKKGMEMLEDVDIDEISDDDLEAVAGGAVDGEGCSNWCCSDGTGTAEDPALV